MGAQEQGPGGTMTVTYMLRCCLAFSMSLLISGVMLKRSFLGMGRGTMGERTSSGFFLRGAEWGWGPHWSWSRLGSAAARIQTQVLCLLPFKRLIPRGKGQ